MSGMGERFYPTGIRDFDQFIDKQIRLLDSQRGYLLCMGTLRGYKMGREVGYLLYFDGNLQCPIDDRLMQVRLIEVQVIQ